MTEDSPRLQEFQSQVDDLRLAGGRVNPERTAVRLGVALFIVSVGLGIIAYAGSTSATDPRVQTDYVILALLGVVLALGAVALFIRSSMTRYLRYWLIRLVYEDRANTDRLIEALGADARRDTTTGGGV